MHECNMKLLHSLLQGFAFMSHGGNRELMTDSLSASLPPLLSGSRRVYLLRNGHTDWKNRCLVKGGTYDVNLNEQGKREAFLVRDFLRDVPFGLVASSHLTQSEDTADTIWTQFPLAVRIVSHKFCEMRFGEFEKTVLRGPESSLEMRRRFKGFESIIRSNKDIPWPGYGESVAEVENRAMKGLEQLLRDFPACDHLCIVGHSHFNKILLTSLLGRHDQLVGNQGSTCVNVMDVDPDGK
jgi:broad specificity phosphatase PhoE